MPDNNDILSFLSTTPESASPQQIEDAREHAKSLLNSKLPESMSSNWQGINYVLEKLLGGYQLGQANRAKNANELKAYGFDNSGSATPGLPDNNRLPTNAKNDAILKNLGGDKYASITSKIESDGDPYNVTGSNKGEFQFGPSEEKLYGINDKNRYDHNTQLSALQKEKDTHANRFSSVSGRAPTDGESYVMHQQGLAGGMALLNNPDKPAWEAIRQFYPNERIAKSAISGNIPSNSPLSKIPVEKITAGEFAQLWKSRYEEQPQATVAKAPLAGLAPPSALGGPKLGPGAEVADTATGGPVALTKAAAPQAAPPIQVAKGTPVNEEPGPPFGQLPITSDGQPAPTVPPIDDETIQPLIDPTESKAANIQVADNSGTAVAKSLVTPKGPYAEKLPPPVPSNVGILSKDQLLHLRFVPPETQKVILEQNALVKQRYEPVYTETAKGKQWRIPATGETGFIPKEYDTKEKVGTIERNLHVSVDPQTGELITKPLSGGGQSTNDLQDQQIKKDIFKAGEIDRTKKQIEYYDTKDHQIQDTASKSQDILANIKLQRKLIDDPNTYQGIGVNKVLDVGKFLSAIGMTTGTTTQNIQALDKLRSEQALEEVKSLGGQGLGAVRVGELQFIKSKLGSSDNTPESLRLINNLQEKIHQRLIDVSSLAEEYKAANGGFLDKGWDQYLAKYKNENPLIPPEELKGYTKFFNKSGQPNNGETNTPDKLVPTYNEQTKKYEWKYPERAK